MSYEFKKLSEVESLSEVPETATVLAEVDGTIKRIPSNGLGGAFKTAIIKKYDYDDAVAALASGGGGGDEKSIKMSGSSSPEYDCTNMAFEEAYEILAACEPLDVIVMDVTDIPATFIIRAVVYFCGTMTYGFPVIVIEVDGMPLFWTADGIYTNDPSGGGGVE